MDGKARTVVGSTRKEGTPGLIAVNAFPGQISGHDQVQHCQDVDYRLYYLDISELLYGICDKGSRCPVRLRCCDRKRAMGPQPF